MKYRNWCLAIIILILYSSSAISQSTIEEAENYFFGLDLEKATHSYLNIFKDEKASSEDRVKAGRKLSYISWHFYNDLDKAKEYATKSLDFNATKASVYSDLIQYESEANNYTGAIQIHQNSLSELASEVNRDILYTAYAKMVLNEAFDKITREQMPDEARLKDALAKIEEVNRNKSGNLEPAKIQLGLALLLKNGKRALHAWNLYYHIQDKEQVKGLLIEPYEKLTLIFKKWDYEDLYKNDIEELIKNLGASRFYQFAFMMIEFFDLNKNLSEGKISDIYYYYNYTIQVEEIAFSYYKDLSESELENTPDFEEEINAIQKDLWYKLQWEKGEPKYSDQKFREEMYKRFGTKIYDGTFSNSKYYIGGHSILDTTVRIEQFNRQAEIQYIILDHRFSNNYWGWFTGYMGFAGYANGSLIVKYREPASDQPANYWEKLNDPVLHEDWLKKTEELSLRDDQIAISDPKATLSGTYNRIRMNIYSQIIDSLRSAGFHGEQLRLQFLSCFEEIVYNTNLNHEGRHAIDFNTLKRKEIDDGVEMEYRAKLSQIYFAQYPLLEIGFDIDNTPHGLANEKILIVFKNWMEQNKEQIDGFDFDRPCLPQLDLLSANQIRYVIGSVEPFLN